MVSPADGFWWETDHQGSPDPEVPVVDPWDPTTLQSASSHVRSKETNKRDGAEDRRRDVKPPSRPRDVNGTTALGSIDKQEQETATLRHINEQFDDAQTPASDQFSNDSLSDGGEGDLFTESDEYKTIDFDSFHIKANKSVDYIELSSIATFDDEARQSPWVETFESEELAETQHFIRANEKAAETVDYFEYKTPRERDDVYQYLVEFFSEHAHNKTFESIRSIALRSPDLSLLRTVVNLRMMWMDREDICDRWKFFRFHRSLKITWDAAYAVCIYRHEYPFEEMIDDGWVGEWLELPIGGSVYWSFSAFLTKKIADFEVERLYHGLNLLFPREPDETYEESIDECRQLICQDSL